MAEKAQRRTRAQIEKDEEDAARFAATKAMIIDRADRARALRSKDREFHGLDREFAYAQQELTSSYLKSRDVKHPRDVGAIRETPPSKLLGGQRSFAEALWSFRCEFSRCVNVGPYEQGNRYCLV